MRYTHIHGHGLRDGRGVSHAAASGTHGLERASIGVSRRLSRLNLLIMFFYTLLQTISTVHSKSAAKWLDDGWDKMGDATYTVVI